MNDFGIAVVGIGATGTVLAAALLNQNAETSIAEVLPNAYQRLFHPKSIVVIGASNNEMKPGGRVLKNIKTHGYKGKLWAINPNTSDVLNLPTYSSIEMLPSAPDLAILAIPAAAVLPSIDALGAKGTRAVIVLTSGFGEKDAAGKKLEEKMVAAANAASMVLIGPNCSGFLTQTYKGKFAGMVPDLPGGAVDVISGSGATVDFVMESALRRGLSFGTVINLGNSIQMGVEDLLQMYEENYNSENARILMLYLESIKKPLKLLHFARRLSQKGCTLVGIKSGVTAAGERAAASHTGALATSDTAVSALFQKAGIIRVKSKAEMIDVGCVLACTKGPLKGNRICVITDAGGPGVMLSDELNRQGLELPLLKEKTRALLAEILSPESATSNPIDILPSRTAKDIEGVIGILNREESDRIDAVAIIMGDSGLSDITEIYREISKAMRAGSIPVIPVLGSVISSRAKIEDFISQGHVFFQDEVPLGEALGKVANWHGPEEMTSCLDRYDRKSIASALNGRSGALEPAVVFQILNAAGFRLLSQIEVLKQEDVFSGAKQIGYPLVMKAMGPLHKTDVGGVRLGIANAEQAMAAWETLMRIPNVTGVLLQPMVSGVEVILGASREGHFGHLILFGLGGIYAEALKDIQFALAPVSLTESLRMIRAIRGYPLLEGFRGAKGMDVGVLADYIQRFSQLITDFPQIQEIDLNPIKGNLSDLYAVDARILIN
jgi:acetyltransferase